MFTRKKIAVERFDFENFKLPVGKIMSLAGKQNFDSATKGAETESQYQGLPLPTPMNELRHKPVLLCADHNAQRLLTGVGLSSFSSFLFKPPYKIMNQFPFGLKVLKLSAMLFLLSFARSGHAQDYLVGVRGGASFENHAGYFRQADVFAGRYLPWDWNSYLGLSFKPRVEASMGWLDGGDKDGVVGTVGPVIEMREGKFPVTLEGGVSLTGLSRYDFEQKDLGGWFEFTDHVGLNWHVTKCFTVSCRYQHMSNAGIYHRNPGLNLLMLSTSYSF